MRGIKEAVSAGVWEGICPEWFVDEKNNPIPQCNDSVLVEFIQLNRVNSLMQCLKWCLATGKKSTLAYMKGVCTSHFIPKKTYTIAKPPACIILDVVLAKGGPESIV